MQEPQKASCLGLRGARVYLPFDRDRSFLR